MWASRNAGYGKFKSWGGRSTDRTSDSSCQIGDSSSCGTSLVFVGSVPTSAHRQIDPTISGPEIFGLCKLHSNFKMLWSCQYILFSVSRCSAHENPDRWMVLVVLKCSCDSDSSLSMIARSKYPPSHWHLKKEQVKFLFFMFLFLLIIWLRLWVLRKWPCTIVSY